MSAPLTVGDLRRALEGLPADAQVYVMAFGMPDMGVEGCDHTTQIPWSHDCTDADESHVPGQDCPTVIGLEIRAADIAEIEAAP